MVPRWKGKCVSGPKMEREVCKWSQDGKGSVSVVPRWKGKCVSGLEMEREVCEWSRDGNGSVLYTLFLYSALYLVLYSCVFRILNDIHCLILL